MISNFEKAQQVRVPNHAAVFRDLSSTKTLCHYLHLFEFHHLPSQIYSIHVAFQN